MMNSGKNTFMIQPKFNIIILKNAQSSSCEDDLVQSVLDEIPHIEKFDKYYISPQ